MHTLVMGSLVLIFVTLGWDTSVVGQEVLAPRGELRIVDKHPWNWA